MINNDIASLTKAKSLIDSVIKDESITGCFISYCAHDIRAAMQTGFWDCNVSPKNKNGKFIIIGNKPVRESDNTGGVLTFEIESTKRLPRRSGFNDTRWMEPQKKWPVRVNFKTDDAGFPKIEYRSFLTTKDMDMRGIKNISRNGFIYINGGG